MGIALILLYKNTEMVRRREIVKLYNHHLIINFSSTRSLFSSTWITSEIAESHGKFNNLDVSQVSKEKQKRGDTVPTSAYQGTRTGRVFRSFRKSTNPTCLCHNCYDSSQGRKIGEDFSGALQKMSFWLWNSKSLFYQQPVLGKSFPKYL